jgi:diguanylate cyclase (GGDEF)-like protein
MLYQVIISLAVIALLLANRQRQGLHGGGRVFFGLCFCAIAYVSAAFYPTGGPIAASIQALSFAMLPPLYFCNTKQFTNLALPQWRSLRAFALGVPLLLAIDSTVVLMEAKNPTAIQATLNGPAVWLGYGFGALSIGIGLWRFISTPRQRDTLLMIMLLPLVLAGADILQRQGILPTNTTASLLGAALAFILCFSRSAQGASVRPVPRSALVDQVQDLMVVIDPMQRIVDYNHAAAEWLVHDDASLVGEPVKQNLPQPLVDALANNDNGPIVMPWLPTGTYEDQSLSDQLAAEHWFEAHISTLIVDQQPNGQLLLLKDITRRRRAELALTQKQEELEALNEHLETLANTDGLTGIANRRHTMARLEIELERHRRSGLTLGLLLLDLDHFKQVNDQHGHATGDQVLIEATTCMTNSARENDCIGRVGGEEFAILVVDATPDGPAILAERIRQNIAALNLTSDTGQPVPVRTSIGCVQYQGGRVDGPTLMAIADQALYEAKHAGRNQVRCAVYEPLPSATYNSREPTKLLGQDSATA